MQTKSIHFQNCVWVGQKNETELGVFRHSRARSLISLLIQLQSCLFKLGKAIEMTDIGDFWYQIPGPFHALLCSHWIDYIMKPLNKFKKSKFGVGGWVNKKLNKLLKCSNLVDTGTLLVLKIWINMPTPQVITQTTFLFHIFLDIWWRGISIARNNVEISKQ